MIREPVKQFANTRKICNRFMHSRIYQSLCFTNDRQVISRFSFLHIKCVFSIEEEYFFGKAFNLQIEYNVMVWRICWSVKFVKLNEIWPDLKLMVHSIFSRVNDMFWWRGRLPVKSLFVENLRSKVTPKSKTMNSNLEKNWNFS